MPHHPWQIKQKHDEHRYEAQQKSIVQEMVGISAGYSDPMASLAGLLSRLDVVTGLAVWLHCLHYS